MRVGCPTPTSPRNSTESPRYVERDKEMGYLYNISPFIQPMESTDPARADVGIGPYKGNGLHAIHPAGSV